MYSEVVNRGLVEELQNVYRVNIAGPSTMVALLNSLQMGFKTFAIQKEAVRFESFRGCKTEFNNFEKF
ncbi:MAG: DNA recombination protein RmuC [Clostridia bacterium]